MRVEWTYGAQTVHFVEDLEDDQAQHLADEHAGGLEEGVVEDVHVSIPARRFDFIRPSTQFYQNKVDIT